MIIKLHSDKRNNFALANYHITAAKWHRHEAFTIVELLVVIVVIGILAAITIVSYTGISGRAVTATLQSDLTNASDQLKIYQATYGSYPTALTNNCPSAPTADNTLCIKPSNGNTFTYTSVAPTTFHLTATNTNNSSYSITDTTSPAVATTVNGLAIGSACPAGFIPVPGSGTYGTNDFCVMKYEAKIQGNDNGNQTYSSSFIPESRVSGTPWMNISQTNAIAEAPSTANCPTGCHLITEAEWMTIAQNVLSVASNWSGAAVGSGYIPHGNSDSSAAMDGTTDLTGVDKRTLTLTNGQVIWDLAGNVFEWTTGVTNGTTAQEPGITGAGWGWREWTTVTAQGSLAVNPFPSGTGLAGSSSWTSSNGIGQLYSNADTTGLLGFLRGGSWNRGSDGGVLAMLLDYGPSDTPTSLGFRVSR
jgi:prepilin-type N-terminal cleavage/methylation domain-containing protein